eukprot:TRINITY_DN62119_c0_g1_i1.p1 TRINITY_DN62119_c0_g1~~TRINITY_DN62119_c0_g1_i1.p1  ORF type:complete len:237 (+),score=15.24 TRINITY_DN62119_c0_g1_i1:102-812(+)
MADTIDFRVALGIFSITSAMLTCALSRSYASIVTHADVLGPPLPDRLHDLLPPIVGPATVHLLLFFLLLILAYCIISFRFSLSTLTRFLLCMSVCSIARFVIVLSTTFPLPSTQCHAPFFSVASYAAFLSFISAGVLSGCADFVFSSRAAFGALAVAVVMEFTGRSFRDSAVWIRRTVMVIFIALCLSLIASRMDYTVDVLIAVAVAVCAWRVVPTTLPPPFVQPTWRRHRHRHAA